MSYIDDELQLKIDEANSQKDAYLLPENIKKGVTVFGIEGNYDAGIQTGDADVTAEDIRAGKVAYGKDGKIIGTLNVLDTTDATATSADILAPKTAYVNNQKITGNIDTSYEADGNVLDYTLYVNKTGYNILDIHPKYKLLLLISSVHTTSTMYIAKYTNDISDAEIVTTWDSITNGGVSNGPHRINVAVFSKVLNSLGRLNIFVDTNYGQTAYTNTFYNHIIQIDPYTASIVSNHKVSYGWTGGDQAGVHVAPNPVDADSFLVCCNRSVNAPNGFYLFKYNSTSGTMNTYGYTVVNGSVRSIGVWNEGGTRFIILDKFGVSSSILRVYSTNSSHTSVSQTYSISKSTTNNVCWLTDNYLLYGNNVINYNGTVIKTTSLTNTYGFSIKTANNTICVFNFNTARLYLYQYDPDTYAFTLTQYISGITSWADWNNYEYTRMPRYCYGILFITINANTNYEIAISGDPILTQITTNDTTLINTRKANVEASNVLAGKTYIGLNGYATGSMPDNGTLTYTPGDNNINIPAGYTSGGTINATNITSLNDYKICDALADAILGDLDHTILEYIQGTGIQYINTGYTPTVNTKLEFKISDVLASNNQGLLSAYTTWTDNSYLLYTYNGINWTFGGKRTITTNYVGPHVITLYRGTITCNGNTISTDTGSYPSQINTTLHLFCSGNKTNFAQYKLYYFRIYENNILVRSYIPVKDKASAICLYDEINKTYAYNGGSGSFIGGGL